MNYFHVCDLFDLGLGFNHEFRAFRGYVVVFFSRFMMASLLVAMSSEFYLRSMAI